MWRVLSRGCVWIQMSRHKLLLRPVRCFADQGWKGDEEIHREKPRKRRAPKSTPETEFSDLIRTIQKGIEPEGPEVQIEKTPKFKTEEEKLQYEFVYGHDKVSENLFENLQENHSMLNPISPLWKCIACDQKSETGSKSDHCPKDDKQSCNWEWVCRGCETSNDLNRPKCTSCGGLQWDWVCSCGYRNHAKDKSCDTCGKRRTPLDESFGCWNCGTSNLPIASECKRCHTPNPRMGWTCTKCDFWNQSRSIKNCQHCGRLASRTPEAADGEARFRAMGIEKYRSDFKMQEFGRLVRNRSQAEKDKEKEAKGYLKLVFLDKHFEGEEDDPTRLPDINSEFPIPFPKINLVKKMVHQFNVDKEKEQELKEFFERMKDFQQAKWRKDEKEKFVEELHYLNCKMDSLVNPLKQPNLEAAKLMTELRKNLPIYSATDEHQLDNVDIYGKFEHVTGFHILREVHKFHSKRMEPTPLHIAAREGDVDSVKHLLENQDIDVNAKGSFGVTPLMFAASKGHVEIVEALVEHGADVNQTDELGFNSLGSACAYNQTEVAYFLLDKYAVDVNQPDELKRTVIFNAILENQVDLVKLLLYARSDVWARDYKGEPALWYCHYPEVDPYILALVDDKAKFQLPDVYETFMSELKQRREKIFLREHLTATRARVKISQHQDSLEQQGRDEVNLVDRLRGHNTHAWMWTHEEDEVKPKLQKESDELDPDQMVTLTPEEQWEYSEMVRQIEAEHQLHENDLMTPLQKWDKEWPRMLTADGDVLPHGDEILLHKKHYVNLQHQLDSAKDQMVAKMKNEIPASMKKEYAHDQDILEEKLLELEIDIEKLENIKQDEPVLDTFFEDKIDPVWRDWETQVVLDEKAHFAENEHEGLQQFAEKMNGAVVDTEFDRIVLDQNRPKTGNENLDKFYEMAIEELNRNGDLTLQDRVDLYSHLPLDVGGPGKRLPHMPLFRDLESASIGAGGETAQKLKRKTT